jgi:hypothetical protein
MIFITYLGEKGIFWITIGLLLCLPKQYRKHGILMLLSLAIGSLSMVLTMLGANLLITPHFMGQPLQAVIDLMLPLLLPFNAIKALTNASIVLLLYKPLTLALSRTGLVEHHATYKLSRRSILVTIAAVLILAGSILAFVLVLGGKIGV